MFRKIVATAVWMALLIGIARAADGGGGLKIAAVRVMAVLDASDEMKDFLVKVQDDKKALDAELEKLREGLKKMEANLEHTTYPRESLEYVRMKQDYEFNTYCYHKRRDEVAQKINDMGSAQLVKIVARVEAATEVVAREDHLDVVLKASPSVRDTEARNSEAKFMPSTMLYAGAMYVTPALDVTDKVIKVMNGEYGVRKEKGALEAPAPAPGGGGGVEKKPDEAKPPQKTPADLPIEKPGAGPGGD